MNSYFQQFRNSPFSGSFSLYGRVLVPNLILNIIIAIISVVIILPISAKALGINMFEMGNFGKDFAAQMKEIQSSGGNPMDYLKTYFSNINFGFIFIAFVVGLIITSWQYFLFFKLNDNEVRNNDKGVLNALKSSFSPQIFQILLFIIIYIIFITLSIVLVSIISGFILKALGGIGGLIVFILFVFLIAFWLRLLIAPAAVVHGNMSVGNALSFSWKNINLRRSFLLLLIGIVFCIIAFIGFLIIGSIIAMIGLSSVNESSEITSKSIIIFILTQIVSGLFGAIISTYFYAALSALYFRFSNENNESEEAIQEHLINE